MKLSEYKKVKNEYTSKVSEISRQLILGGIAIIWIFRTTKNDQSILDKSLIWPLTFLSFAIIADLLQYVIGGEIWRKFYRKEEQKLLEQLKVNPEADKDPDRKASGKLKRPIEILYWSKVILLILAYLFIIFFLLRHISFQ